MKSLKSDIGHLCVQNPQKLILISADAFNKNVIKLDAREKNGLLSCCKSLFSGADWSLFGSHSGRK